MLDKQDSVLCSVFYSILGISTVKVGFVEAGFVEAVTIPMVLVNQDGVEEHVKEEESQRKEEGCEEDFDPGGHSLDMAFRQRVFDVVQHVLNFP